MGTLTTSTPGELFEGWGQQESASPHVVGDLAGGTRQTTFTARAGASADLLIGTTVTADGPMDTTGPVLDVTLTGDQVATASYDVDSLFLPNRSFPPISSGFPEAALDLVQRLFGESVVTVPWASTGVIHAYYPLRGYQQGFELGTGRPYTQGTWGRAIVTDTNNNASYYMGEHALRALTWQRYAGSVRCRYTAMLWGPVITGTAVNYACIRVGVNASGYAEYRWALTWSTAEPETVITVRLSRGAGTSGTIQITGSYRQHNAGSLTTISTSPVTVSLDMSKELYFAVQWGWLTDAVNGTLRVKTYCWDPAAVPGGAPTYVQSVDLATAMRSVLVSNGSWVNTSNASFVDMVLSQAPSGTAYYYPTITQPARIVHDFAKTDTGTPPAGQLSMRPPIPAWDGSAWDYLKHLTAAYGLTMRVDSGQLRVSDMGGSPVPIRGATSAPQLSVKGSARARSVDVVAYRSVVSRSFTGDVNVRFSASATIRLNEESQLSFQLPPGEHLAGRVTVKLTDSEGNPVAQSDMWYRGGRFTPVVRDGVLTLTIRGPRDDVGLGTGPWRLTDVEVCDEGFFETPETITLYTAAPDSMVTRDKAGTVQNPFLTSQGDVYERGAWAAQQAGDPEMILTFTVSYTHRADYLPGALVRYGYAVYRVMDVTHTRGDVRVTAVRWTTVAMRDAVWEGKTVAEHDTWATGRRYLDSYIRPLQGVTPGGPFVRSYPSESKLEG